MIMAGLAGLDQVGHHLAGDRCVLELVAAGADPHVETRQIRLVVYRDPIVRHVVKLDHALGLVGDAQPGIALGQAHDHNPPLFAEFPVEIVRIDPFARVAFGVFAADQHIVAKFRPAVGRNIAVRTDHAVTFEIEALGRGHMGNLVAQRPGLDAHALLHAGHLVDLGRMRPRDIDHYRRVDGRPVGKRYARHATVRPANFRDLAIEPEFRAVGLGGALQIMGRELRVGDVAAGREEHRARNFATGRLAKTLVLRALGRAEAFDVQDRHFGEQRFLIQVVAGRADFRHQFHRMRQHAVALGLHHQAAAVDIAGQATLVRRAEEILPVFPVEMALIGDGRAIHRGIVGPDNGAGTARGAIPRRRQFIDHQRLAALAHQPQRGGGADDAGADDDRIV